MFKKFLFVLVFSILGNFTFAQKTSQTKLHNGVKMVWKVNELEIETLNPSTNKIENTKVLERKNLISYNGIEVVNNNKKTINEVTNYISKTLKKTSYAKPTFDGRAVKIHFTNYVVDINGKLCFYEVLIFPYRQSLQLYPNEYDAPIKAYLQVIKEIVDKAPMFENKTGHPIFVDKIYEL